MNDEPLPRRPRREFFNRRSAALAALLTCALGFYAGVRVEKGQSSGSTATTGGGLASRLAALRSAGGTAGGAPGGGGGGPGAFGGGAGGAGASFGTVASVSGHNLYVTEASGNTVKIRLSGSTRITKNESVSRSAVRPGDTVIFTGVPNATGTVVAATVTDSGGSRAAAGGGSSGSSALGSLFSSGG